MHKYFLKTYWYTKEKFTKNQILQKRDLYLNHFQVEKGPLVNLKGWKGTLSGLHIQVPSPRGMWYPCIVHMTPMRCASMYMAY